MKEIFIALWAIVCMWIAWITIFSIPKIWIPPTFVTFVVTGFVVAFVIDWWFSRNKEL